MKAHRKLWEAALKESDPENYVPIFETALIKKEYLEFQSVADCIEFYCSTEEEYRMMALFFALYFSGDLDV